MIQHGLPVRGPSSAGLIRLTAATPTDPGNGSGYRLPRLLAALVAGMLLLGVPAVVDVPPSSFSRDPNPGPASPRRPPRLRQPLVAVERLGALALLPVAVITITMLGVGVGLAAMFADLSMHAGA